MALKLGKVEAVFSSGKKRKAASAAELDQASMYRKINPECGTGLCCASIEGNSNSSINLYSSEIAGLHCSVMRLFMLLLFHGHRDA